MLIALLHLVSFFYVSGYLSFGSQHGLNGCALDSRSQDDLTIFLMPFVQHGLFPVYGVALGISKVYPPSVILNPSNALSM